MSTNGATTIWHPADLFSDDPSKHKDFALIVLNQPLVLPSHIYKTLWDNSVYHIAADGGANEIYNINHKVLGDSFLTSDSAYLDLDTIIGDFDSVQDELTKIYKQKNTELIRDEDQYSTDFTKAVRYTRTFELPTGSTYVPAKSEVRRSRLQKIKETPEPLDIVCLGGLGGRVDQGLSQIHHLFMFQKAPSYSTGKIFLFSSEAITFVLKAGRHEIKIREKGKHMALGKHIGIIPVKEPAVITTKGLEWDVKDWETEFGGQMSTSNHVREDWAVIETNKDVLFTIDLVIYESGKANGVVGGSS